jgi:aspartyl protease family protein
MRPAFCIAALVAGCLGLAPAWAASAYVKALGHGTAEVVINGAEPRLMWEGETSPEGVTLRRVTEESALLQIDGLLWTLRPGQGTYSQATLNADPDGQFFLTALVNGTPLRAIIDTGASAIAMNSEDAQRMGVDYLRGRRVQVQTASGTTSAYLVTFSSVQVGSIVLKDVAGTVLEVGRRELPVVLIGMSFLRNVEMRRSGDTMLLHRKDY